MKTYVHGVPLSICSVFTPVMCLVMHAKVLVLTCEECWAQYVSNIQFARCVVEAFPSVHDMFAIADVLAIQARPVPWHACMHDVGSTQQVAC